MDFQTMIETLHRFWRDMGCTILQPYDVEKGAATLGPQTFLRALGPDPWSVAYVDPCRRPTDSRFMRDADRLQRYYQYQVLLKPSLPPERAQAVFLESLGMLGLDLTRHEVRFHDDAWESPVFGARGTGWEVWLDGVEIAQLTYFEQCGGIPCEKRPLEITYGLERLALTLQGRTSFARLSWDGLTTYGDVHGDEELEFSAYNLNLADPELLRARLDLYAREAEHLASLELIHPGLDAILKWSHTFNVLDARQAFTPHERDALIGQVRQWAHALGLAYLRRHREAVAC